MKAMKLDNAKKVLQQGNAIESNIDRCEICGGAHSTAECQASEEMAAQQVLSTLTHDINAVGNFNRNQNHGGGYHTQQ